MGLLLAIPLSVAGSAYRQVKGVTEYNEASTFGKAAKALDREIQELGKKTLFKKTLLYPVLTSGWMFSHILSRFNTSSSIESIADRITNMDTILTRISTKLEEIQEEIERFNKAFEQQYENLAREVDALQETDRKQHQRLKERCEYLRRTREVLQAKLTTAETYSETVRGSNWQKAKELFQQTRNENAKWLEKINELDRRCTSKENRDQNAPLAIYA